MKFHFFMKAVEVFGTEIMNRKTKKELKRSLVL